MLDLQGLRKSLRGRLKRGDFRGAAVYLEAVLARAPQPETALHLAQMYTRCRAYPVCLTHLQKARAQWPEDLALLRSFAETAMLAKDFLQARDAWQDLIAHQNPDAPYPILRALACLRATGPHNAAQDFVTQHGDGLRKYMARTGVQMLRKGRWSTSDLPPGLYLVTGNNGTGKSTMGHFLQAMGYAIIDADTEIASFCYKGQFSDLRYDLTRKTGGTEADLRWSWPESRVTRSFAAALERKEPVFVIGGHGATVAPHISRFRHVFHLVAPDCVVAGRLAKRNSLSHKVGSVGYDAALRRNARAQVPAYAATLVASDRPVWAVCANVLSGIVEDASAGEARPSP